MSSPETDGTAASAQDQTESTFAYKWHRRDTYESSAVQDVSREWLFERYCGGDPSVVDVWLAGGRKRILDAGCGAGYSAILFFGDRLHEHDYLGIDISSAVDVARVRFAERGLPGSFRQEGILETTVPPGSVDLVLAEGVLHHTNSTEAALKTLAGTLAPGGRFLFYVYAKKAVVREFTDDHVRDALASMDDATAWDALMPLTRLGQALGKLNVEVDVPEDIPFLGIKRGRIDIQRFFYWNICKLYYRSNWTLDEMNHVNFDWFRPSNGHRQTPEEVRQWCDEAGLEIERFNVQEAGITVVARRPVSAQ
jgi:SAM-dependent methyltransferase